MVRTSRLLLSNAVGFYENDRQMPNELVHQEAVYFFNRYLLSIYFVPGTILGMEHITVMEAESLLIS